MRYWLFGIHTLNIVDTAEVGRTWQLCKEYTALADGLNN